VKNLLHKLASIGAAPTIAAPELASEFHGQTLALLRRRFLWFSGLLSLFGLTSIAVALISWAFDIGIKRFVAPGMPVMLDKPMNFVLSLGVVGAATAIYCLCFWRVRRREISGDKLLRYTFLLVVVDGLIHVATYFVPGAPSMGLWGVLIVHLTACLFLPWTPVQAVIPLIPVLALWAALRMAVGDGELVWRLVWLPLGVLVGVPGVLVCALRHMQRVQTFENAFLMRRYRDVRRELVDARRIHESLFPRPISDGPFRLSYKYEPMQQIGGDFLFVHATPDHPHLLSVLVIDVTGHGIIAALTVNRVWGELTRIYAERPDIAPGEVLRLLNRYAHLTLAPHAIYMTALCARIDARAGALEYASGGHPPAFVLRTDGSREELHATSLVLGACGEPDFDAAQARVAFNPGDRLLAYTDGVIEALGLQGRLLGLKGFRSMLDKTPVDPEVGLCPPLVKALTGFRLGPAADDTLLVEVWREGEDPAPGGARAAWSSGATA